MSAANETNRKAYFIGVMKRRILSGKLKPGDRIPPERELAGELGISRGSVNQGMLDLACDCVSWSRKHRVGFISRQGVYESPSLVPRRTSGQNVPNLWTHSQKADRFFSQN